MTGKIWGFFDKKLKISKENRSFSGRVFFPQKCSPQRWRFKGILVKCPSSRGEGERRASLDRKVHGYDAYREMFLWDRSVLLEGSLIRPDFWQVCELLQKHSAITCRVVSSAVCFRLF